MGRVGELRGVAMKLNGVVSYPCSHQNENGGNGVRGGECNYESVVIPTCINVTKPCGILMILRMSSFARVLEDAGHPAHVRLAR